MPGRGATPGRPGIPPTPLGEAEAGFGGGTGRGATIEAWPAGTGRSCGTDSVGDIGRRGGIGPTGGRSGAPGAVRGATDPGTGRVGAPGAMRGAGEDGAVGAAAGAAAGASGSSGGATGRAAAISNGT